MNSETEIRDKACSSKIFGIGLAKTGTTSLHNALKMLGYNMIKVVHKDGPRVGQWVTLEDFMAADGGTDLVVAAMFEELDRAFPGSKFIYTPRNLEHWLTSIRTHIYHRGFECYDWMNSPEWPNYVRMRAYGRCPPLTWNDRNDPVLVDWWSAVYFKHHDRVTNYFKDRPQDLLTLEICNHDIDGREHWAKLMDFTQKADLVFPHNNKTFKQLGTKLVSDEPEKTSVETQE